MTNKLKVKKIYSKATIFYACSIFVIIFIGQILGITSANDLIERKEIARFPKINFKNSNLIDELNRYFQDNFGFRNVLLKQYLSIKFNLFKAYRLGNVEYVDNAMTIGEASAWQDRSEILRNIFYSEADLISWKNFLEMEKRYIESQGIPFFLVVIPDREIISDELTPYTNSINYLRHKQFVDYMKKNSPVKIIDPTDALLKEKDKFPLYYKTDTHWTNYGAYITYLEVIKYMGKFKDELKPYEKEDFNIELEKYDLWLGDRGFNYPNNPNRPDAGVKFTLRNDSINKYSRLGALLIYGDSYLDIQRRACIPCLVQKFPELKSLIPLLFTKPSEDKLLDPNPDYWFPKARIEQLIPVIKENIKDKKSQDKIISYLMIQGLLPDRVGLNHFFRLNFEKVIPRDIELKLEQSLIDEYKPDFVIREVVEGRIQHSFSRINCFYNWDKSFDNSASLSSANTC